ncbi:RICIN domain-containing protein [Aquimarina agarivorans]|uniref:RICIN domain-containing protein n=1 Tax=Aquimarina agarivorans TaxID=980584 RepID=UPI000248EF81|nr:RICIN domain-containing protein [Aquimarina agarivorans]
MENYSQKKDALFYADHKTTKKQQKTTYGRRVLTSRLVLIVLFFTSFISVNTIIGQNHNWKRTNPGGGGWFGCVGASKSGIVLAGSDLSGAYRSKNGGKSWDVIGASKGFEDTHVGGMGFHRTNGNIMFLGTGGMYKTADGGDSWKKVVTEKGYVSDIEFGTNKPNIGYASFHKGNWNSKVAQVLKTTNNGDTWKKVSTNLPETRIIKIVANPKNANEVYLLTGKGRPACAIADLYKSTNGGVTWTNLTKNTKFEGHPEVVDVAIDPNNPNTLYITTAAANCDNRFWFDNQEGRLFKSTDGGKSWKKLQDQVGQVFVNPKNSAKITLIVSRILAEWNDRSGTYVSENGGKTFKKVSQVAKWEPTFHGEIQGTYSTTADGLARTIGDDLSNANNFYWVNSQWVTGSKDGGKNFKVMHANQISKGKWQSTGFDNVNMVDADISEVDRNTMYTAWYDIGFWRSLDRGKTWESGNNGKYGWKGGKGGNCFSVVSDPERRNVVWTVLTSGQKSETPTFVLKSTNKGHKDSWKESKGLPKTKISGLSLDRKSPKNNRTLYVTAQGDVYKSTNDGQNWSKVYDCKGCRFTAVDEFNGNIVYAGGEAGLKRSTDAGKSWKDVSHKEMKGKSGVDFWEFNPYTGIYDIKTDPNNKNWLYVTAKGNKKGLYKSTNRGDTWTKLLTDDYMRKVGIASQNSKIIYATSSSAVHSGGYKKNSNGVLFSNDGGKTWKKQNKGMAYPFAMSVTIDRSKKPMVLLGSPGTGFQMSSVPGLGGISTKPAPVTPPAEKPIAGKPTPQPSPSPAGQKPNNVTVEGVFTIQNVTSKQNIIAPTWDKHNARMYRVLGAKDQQWEFIPLGKREHHIVNVGTKRYLEVSAGKCGENANVNTWTSGGAKHQKWYVTKNENDYFLRPVHCSKFALDKSSGNNGNVKIWQYNTANVNQKFNLNKVKTKAEASGEVQINGTYIIQNTLSKQNVIAPDWDDHKVRMYASEKVFNDHMWIIKHVGNGLHTLKSVRSNRYLEVSNAKCTNGALVSTWTNANGTHKKWKIEKENNTYYLIPAHCEALALDKSNGDNKRVVLWKKSKTNSNQKFELIAVNGSKILADLDANSSEITFYPNPADQVIDLDLSNYEGQAVNYGIISLTGKTLIEAKIDENHGAVETVLIDQIPLGVYMLKLEAGSISRFKKLVVFKK